MQMMFFYLFVLTIFFTTRNVESIKNNINFYDDIFYGDSFSFKNSNLKNMNNEISKGNIRQVVPNIKNFNDYFTNYKSLLLKPTDFITKQKGKCLNFFNFKELFINKNNENVQNIKNKDIHENLNSISHYLNDLNYLFKDEYGNFLIFSVCKNFFFYSNGITSDNNENYIKCFQRFIFISKIDFSFYSFLFSGEKIPSLVNFSVDFAIDDFSHKKFLILFGGIDAKGNHNSDIYRFDIDYSFGNININKITSIDLNNPKNLFLPQGLSDSSYNIVQYEKENLSYKKNYISIIFGGNNDESISNKLYVYKHETSTWLSHSINADSRMIPRKGHSAVITKNNLFEKDHLKNENVIKTYNLIIFGGKSINAYLNDIIIFTVNYAVLDDKIYFEYKQLENNKDIIGDFPEPREGHKSFIKGDYFYVYGGCNYNIKKCYYDSMYKINLNNFPFKWEKEILFVNKINSKNIKFEEEKIGFNNLKNAEKMSNFVVYKDALINIGICKSNEDNCKNRFNLILPDSICFNDRNNFSNIENNQCGLTNENLDSKFNWNFECRSNNLNNITDKKHNMKTNNISINNNTKIYKREDNEYLKENSLINISVNKEENEKFDEIMNNFIHENNLNPLFNDNNKKKIEPINDKKLNKISKIKQDKIELVNVLNKNEDSNFNNDEKFFELINNYNINKKLNLNDDDLLKNNLFKFFKENILKSKNINNNYKIKPTSNNEEKLFGNNIKNNFHNNSSKINFIKKNKKFYKKKSFNENELFEKLEKIISNNMKNSSLKIYEVLEKKFQNYINQTELNNKNINYTITRLIKDNFKNLEHENLKLKKIIFNNEIKPLIKENLFLNNSANEINFLNFDERLLNFSEQIKRKKIEDLKEKSLKEYKKNSELTKNLEKNISEIKNFINKENEDTKKNLNNMISNLIKKIENIDVIMQKKFSRLGQFINNQEKINNSTHEILLNEELRKTKAIKQCFNGFLINETFCQCLPGFSGENCEIILTCEDDCSGNGNCHYGKCFCNPGFSGSKCEKGIECKENCNNRGKCHLGKCYCDYGFDGILCENKIKCSNNCGNKGICFRGKCICEPGFTGEDCSQIAIKFDSCKNNCNKNGVCKMEKCFCYPGYSGKYCEIKHKFACPSNIDILKNTKDITNNSTSIENKTYSPCSGNGLCKYGMCFCYPGYIGKACEQKEQCKNNCTYNGICIKGKCHCKNNSKNDDCSESSQIIDNSTLKNETVQINTINNKRLINLDKRNKEIFDFHFIQIDKDIENQKINKNLNKKFDDKIDFDITKAIKIDEENENIKEKNSFENEDSKKTRNKNTKFSLIDEKTGHKYNYNPEGIYVGKETVEKIIYTAMILISIVFSILVTIYLNKRFSK